MSRPLVLFLLLSLPACVSHSVAADFSGVDGIRGEPIEYQLTTTWSLHALFVFGLLGDSSTRNTVREFTKEASQRGAKRVRITHSGSTTFWYILPPLSFIFHPVRTTVQGDVEGSATELGQ
jgi:hypothetical protein